MSDLFISYASADRDRARRVAEALQRRGWSIWWDREIPPGRQYDEVIDEALAAARCVVVLWTQASTASSWVKNEASEAMDRRVLIPAVLDPGLKIPLEFRRVQAADLSRWQGEASTPEFELFCAAIARIVSAPGPGPTPPPGPSPQPPVPPAPVPAPSPKGHGLRNALVGAGLVVAVLVAVGLWNDGEEPAPSVLPISGPGAAPGTTPAPAPAAIAPLAGAVHIDLTWRDDVLRYTGTLRWDGRSPDAQVSMRIVDAPTGASLGSRELAATMLIDAPGRVVFSTSVPVAGDSRTAGAHSHAVHLVFEMQPNGRWMFVRNCMAPNNCWNAGT